MARRRSLTSQLYRAARLSDDLSALASGNPKRVARRARNEILGREAGPSWDLAMTHPAHTHTPPAQD